MTPTASGFGYPLPILNCWSIIWRIELLRRRGERMNAKGYLCANCDKLVDGAIRQLDGTFLCVPCQRHQELHQAVEEHDGLHKGSLLQESSPLRQPYPCPVCLGSGVATGFYVREHGPNCGLPCLDCEGKGIVWG